MTGPAHARKARTTDDSGRPPIISVRHLSKSYGDVLAVDDISFDVFPATTFAFLGTNGAGKSTTIRALATILAPSSGSIEVAGHTVGRDDEAVRRSIGLVFQGSVLDPILNVRENLLLRARFYGIEKRAARARVDDLAALLELEDFLDRRYGSLSGGQRRRADIVRALLHDPAVLFLDEPTTGLDPDSREKVWSVVSALQGSLGLTIFLTTHYMEETERADAVQVISTGRIVASGTPAELRARYSRHELRLDLRSNRRIDAALVAGQFAVEVQGRSRRVQVRSGAEALDLVTRFKEDITDFEFRHGTMDDVFLNLTRERSETES